MMFKMNLLLFFLLVGLAVSNCSSLQPLVPSESYTHSFTVDEEKPQQYKLFWKFLDNKEIQFEVHCNTTGWVSLGLSPNGGMPGSDVAIGWFKNGKAFLKDCFARSQSTPLTDPKQDLFLIDGAEVNGYTILKFKRFLTTCDEDNDREIKIGTQYMIFAWNDADPLTGNNDWLYHGPVKRLQRTLMLITYKDEAMDQQNTLPSDFYTHSMRLSVTIEPKDTYYWCDLFKLPAFTKPTHLIQFEMLVNAKNKRHVHHLLVYECEDEFEPERELAIECGLFPLPQNVVKNCTSKIILAWATGGLNNYTFPKDAGYPFAPTKKPKYLLLEMHYANTELLSGIYDDSGIKLYFTEKLRKHDLGLLELGIDTNPIAIQIPPNSAQLTYTSICYPECTAKYFPPDGIYAVSGLLHTHLAGRSVRTTLVRNGSVVKELFDNPTYDYNFQFIIDVEPTKLLKGDVLITECKFNTIARKKFTFFGIGTYDEMCFDFLYYYPRIPSLSSCSSGVPTKVLKSFYHSLMSESLIPLIDFDETNYYNNQFELMEYLQKKVDATPKLVQRFEEFFASSYNKSLYCGGTGAGNSLYRDNVAHYAITRNTTNSTVCVARPLNNSNKANLNFFYIVVVVLYYSILK